MKLNKEPTTRLCSGFLSMTKREVPLVLRPGMKL